MKRVMSLLVLLALAASAPAHRPGAQDLWEPLEYYNGSIDLRSAPMTSLKIG